MSNVERPWLDRRPGESRHEWLIRQQRSCYFCAHPAFGTGKEADAHEIACGKRTREEREAFLARHVRARP